MHRLLIILLCLTFFGCYLPPLSDDDTDTDSDTGSDTGFQTPTETQILEFSPEVQDQYDDIILEAFSILTKTELEFIDYKALIATESSFDADAVSPTGAKGLLQFTEIAMEDVNDSPGDMPFYFSDRFDPKQAIYAGLRLFELIVYRLDYYYFDDYDRMKDLEYKQVVLTTYNAGIGTMVDAIDFATANADTTFDEICFPLRDTDGIEDTPMYRSIIMNASANGVTKPGGGIDYDALEDRYHEVTSYSDKILSLIP